MGWFKRRLIQIPSRLITTGLIIVAIIAFTSDEALIGVAFLAGAGLSIWGQIKLLGWYDDNYD